MAEEVVLMLKHNLEGGGGGGEPNKKKNIPLQSSFSFYCRRVYGGGERDIHWSTLLARYASADDRTLTSFVLQKNFTCKLKTRKEKSYIVHGSESQKDPCSPKNVNSKVQGSSVEGC